MPNCAAWFAREQAFDAAIAAKLREINPPAELRDNIIAGGRDRHARASPGRDGEGPDHQTGTFATVRS